MKKNKIFKFLATGSLFTTVVSAPLITTLTSCGEKTTSSSNEYIASDKKTKITALSNTYKLIHPFDNNSFQGLKELAKLQQNHTGTDVGQPENVATIVHSTNYVLNEKIKGSFLFQNRDVIFLEDDFTKFVELFKINNEKIPISGEFISSIPDGVSMPSDFYEKTLHSKKENKTFLRRFIIRNLNIKDTEKTITFDLSLELFYVEEQNVNSEPVTVWTVDLKKFTFTNVI